MLSNWKDSRSLRYAALLLGRSASVERTGFDRANCKLLKLAGTHDFAGKHNSPGRIPGCKTSNTRIKRSRRRAWASAPNLLSAVTASASMCLPSQRREPVAAGELRASTGPECGAQPGVH